MFLFSKVRASHDSSTAEREAITITTLTERARETLNGAWLGTHTKINEMYPHQWGWDAPFLSMGWATFKPERARQELTSQLSHQWSNGMIPQIIFHDGEARQYFPGPERWQAHPHSGQDGAPTSGCVQPPLQAIGVRRVAQALPDGRDFLKWAYPRLLQWHRYLYRERDPDGRGLVYVRHPWETGLDNLPDWDGSLFGFELSDIPAYERKDNQHVDDRHRPDNEYYDRYTALVDRFRAADYDEAAIRNNCPFLVEDPAYNAMLCAANRALIDIARQLDRSATEPEQWFRATSQGLRDQLYDNGRFYAYDRYNETMLDDHESLMGYIPLFGGAPTDRQAQSMVDRLDAMGYFDTRYALPTTSPDDPAFDPEKYWRGPVWGFTNWLMIRGLSDYGFHDRARSIEQGSLELIQRHGFCENHHPQSGEPTGAKGFTVTAALFLERAQNNSCPKTDAPS